MKTLLLSLTALFLALPLAAEDDSSIPSPEAHPEIGRFQIAEIGNYQILLDTATGRVWQVSRRGASLVMEPVLYEHNEDVKQPLPDFVPEPVDADLYLPDPELEAQRLADARKFVNVTISEPIMGFATTMGAFPPNLAALTTNLSNSPRWQGPYLRASAIDPWGNRYRYKYPGEKNPDTYDVWSLGPDGKPSSDDIGNW